MLNDLSVDVAVALQQPLERISVEMVFRSLYFFDRADRTIHNYNLYHVRQITHNKRTPPRRLLGEQKLHFSSLGFRVLYLIARTSYYSLVG
ncbi:hypothetical protein [Nostoc sp. LPT]|uniref:hypothetical protein n=1 Tax=Nostoc sp. LPT TaxID=2815387 RepID=UPI001E04FBA3|nr:hypothetical protein [Nostoc sp. LPT]MBN4000646.1 hypothetical protein [Nostoc sp. LPT]